MSPSLQPASDHSLLISFGGENFLEPRRMVHALTRALFENPSAFILNIHPAHSSVLVVFDPLRATFLQVEEFIRSRLISSGSNPAPAQRQLEIPVCYDEEFAPDADDVAKMNSLTHEEVVAIHSAGSYFVQFIGFTPGFAYLGGMSERLATPRLASPRARVPAGSVAIGGSQTAVYPISTPGGWRIIGRTPIKLFSPEKEPFSLLALGDHVRFRKISREEFYAQNEIE